MCWDSWESCSFAVVKRWIEGEGHRRSHFYRQSFHLCRYACKDARYLLSVALSFGWWVIVPPRRKRVAEQRNIFVVSPDLNCWGWMIEQRKSGNIWAVAILPRSGSVLLWDSGKESKQPQQLERERKLAKPLVDSGRFIIFAAEIPP